MLTSHFDYDLPDRAIAQTPIEPRDRSRLLDTSTGQDHLFEDLPRMLSPGDLVVVNDTRVRAARLQARKVETGGAVEVLLLERQAGDEWTAMVKPARRLRKGSLLVAGPIRAELLSDPDGGIVQLALEAPTDIEDAVARVGEVPLPPYITADLNDPWRYQTVYADTPGSAAAPTAGLHFTSGVLDEVDARGIERAQVELRVGIGTFRPISTERVEEHVMHPEWISVSESTVAAVADTRRRGGRVVAIGTTVVRALESAAPDGELKPWEGHTDLFITPGFRFSVVDRLVTNFHMPRSSLIVMVAAFMGPEWRRNYELALDRGYRFLSFGDAMLADRADLVRA